MGSKRRLPPVAEAEEDGNRSQIAKRWRAALVQDVVAELRPLLLGHVERLIRRVVPEEVLKLSANHVQPASRLLINQDKEIKYRLHFQNKLPQEIFTFSGIVAADGMKLQIAIMDSNLKEVITSNPLSSVKVEIVVVNGDFGGDGQKNWTEEEFKDNVVSQRDNRGQLLMGELVIKLNNGIGYLSCAKFTDNSSWTRSQKFRLAVRIFQNENIEERVQEGISEPFRVKDRRVESNQKHHPPLLTDEVWRLDHIMRDGVFHKRLEKGGIHTVQQFLQAFTMRPEWLQTLLCDEVSKKRIPNKRWDAIIAHAKECLLGGDLHTYTVASRQKSVENWKELPFKNPTDIHKMDDNLPQPITPINVPSDAGSSLWDSQIPYYYAKNHDEATIQAGLWHPTDAPYNKHSNVLFGQEDWSPDEATTQVGLWHQPNAPHNEHSNVLLGLEDSPVPANRVQSIQESSSLQEPEVSNGLPVGSIPMHPPTAIDTTFPGPILPSYPPATYADEAAIDMGFQQPLQDISSEQDFDLFPHTAFFHGNVSHMNHILDDCSFGTESGRVDQCMLQRDEGMGLEDEAVPTSPRKWVKLIAGLKCGLSISKYLAARRLELCIVVSKQ